MFILISRYSSSPISLLKSQFPAKKTIQLPKFISVQKPQKSELLETLKLVLDLGESEAIALALELESKLIIDEKKGRKIAMKQGLEIIGLLGIVYLNIKKGFLEKDEAKAFLDEAINHGYRINQKLINDMLKRVS